jgi:hypothetical protein
MNDTHFDALANEHRRNLLVALLDENPQDPVVLASRDGDAGVVETTHRLQTAMYHSHLPKLVESGCIEWHRDTQEIVRGPLFEEIQPLLECVDEYTEN